MRKLWVLATLVALAGCDDGSGTDAGPTADAGSTDQDAGPSGSDDAGPADMDSGPSTDDGGSTPDDAGAPDAGAPDAGPPPDPMWQPPVLLETETPQPGDPQVGHDAAGDAIVAFTQSDGSWQQGLATHYTGGSFGAPVPIAAITGQHAGMRGLAVSASGDAVAGLVMTRPMERFRYDLLASGFDSSMGTWSAPAFIEMQSSNTNHVAVAGSPNGNAVAVWVSFRSLWAAQYRPASGWAAPQEVRTGGSASLVYPAAAINDSGVAFVAWTESDSGRTTWASRFDGMSTWATPARLDNNDMDDAQYTRVVMAGDDSAIVVWEQDDSFGSGGVFSNRYAGGAWAGTVALESAREQADRPEMAIDAAGNVTVAWVHDRRLLFVSRRDAMTGMWSTPMEVARDVADSFDFTNNPRLMAGADDAGNVHVVFSGIGAMMTEDLNAVRYVAASGMWEPAVTIAAGIELVTDNQLDVASNGVATLVWVQRVGGQDDLYAARFE